MQLQAREKEHRASKVKKDTALCSMQAVWQPPRTRKPFKALVGELESHVEKTKGDGRGTGNTEAQGLRTGLSARAQTKDGAKDMALTLKWRWGVETSKMGRGENEMEGDCLEIYKLLSAFLESFSKLRNGDVTNDRDEHAQAGQNKGQVTSSIQCLPGQEERWPTPPEAVDRLIAAKKNAQH